MYRFELLISVSKLGFTWKMASNYVILALYYTMYTFWKWLVFKPVLNYIQAAPSQPNPEN